MSKTKNPLLAFTEGWERSRAEELVDAILNNKIFVIVNKNNLQAQFLKKDDKYISQFTVVLVRWGYLKGVKGNDFNCKLNKYCPNQSISASLSWFMHDAEEAGLWDGSRKFDGGESYDTIFI